MSAYKRICILIPTYKRNEFLERLLEFVSRALQDYRGPNIYGVVITDSDHSNPTASRLSGLNQISYVLNPGKGFDDNFAQLPRVNLGCFA